MITTIRTTAPMPTAICQSACVSNAAMSHLPTATFLRARAMCRIRTAQSLTSSTPVVEAGGLGADHVHAGRRSRAWSAMRAASVRMVATMMTTTTITMNDSEKPMYQSVYVAPMITCYTRRRYR